MSEVKNNLYNDIIRRLAGWFGLNAEEATEAEVHQRVVEHDGTIKAMAEQIAELKSTLSASLEEVSALKSRIDEHAKVIEEQATTIAQLIEERDRLKAELDSANVALEAQIKSNQALATEVARMRAGAEGPTQTSIDKDEQYNNLHRPRSGGVVIPAGYLFKNLTRN